MKHATRIASLFLSVLLTLTFVPAPARAAARTFSDVPSDAWYAPYVAEAAERGIVKGYEDGTFRPNSDVAEVEAVAIVERAFPCDEIVNRDPDRYKLFLDYFKEANGEEYWGNDALAKFYLVTKQNRTSPDGLPKSKYVGPAHRALVAYMLGEFISNYREINGMEKLPAYNEARALVGDFDAEFNDDSKMVYAPYVLWLYTNGIVSGVNETGDYRPFKHITRAELSKMVITALHPELWIQYDWDVIDEAYANGQLAPRSRAVISNGSTGTTPSIPASTSNKDFTGKERIRYDEDIAFDYCRALESQIGIQIFYLPEWTEKPGGVVTLEDLRQFTFRQDYFEMVLTELQKMKAAFDCYPDGFLKEVVAKKNNRKTEIILFPGKVDGMEQFGLHVYDETNDAQKVDQVYYTGTGDVHFYSHEMGHMVMSSAAILNGWSETTKKWESIGDITSYVSAYAMQSRPEDWAETWAWCWHNTQEVINMCRSNPGLLEKVRYMTEILDKNYNTIEASKLPWAAILS